MTADQANPSAERKTGDAPKRKARGFLRAGALTPKVMKSVGAKRGFVEARLLTDWPAVAGAEIAALCRPVRVSYAGRGAALGATLVVAVEGARAPEAQMRAPQIVARVNAFYGYRAISRLAIDQSRCAGDRSGPAETWPAPPEARYVVGVADERFALALGRLGANIRHKAAAPAPKRRTE